MTRLQALTIFDELQERANLILSIEGRIEFYNKTAYPELANIYWNYIQNIIRVRDYAETCIKEIQLSDTKLRQVLR